MMHVSAKHQTVHTWMEHSLNPKLQGDLASWFGSVPVVPAACKGNKLLGDKGCETNGMDEFDKIWFGAPTGNCGSKPCVPYYRWVTDYITILGGR
jgi:putative spermidine/putrescine transport system substrate-binding protein